MAPLGYSTSATCPRTLSKALRLARALPDLMRTRPRRDDGGLDDPVQLDVLCELVVPDLYGRKDAVAIPDLVGEANPAPHTVQCILLDPIVPEQASPEGAARPELRSPE